MTKILFTILNNNYSSIENPLAFVLEEDMFVLLVILSYLKLYFK